MRHDLSLAVALTCSGYLIVLMWYYICSLICGSKLLESGVIDGVCFIDWNSIDEYSFKKEFDKHQKLRKTTIQLKCGGQLMTRRIVIKTENMDLVERLFSEKCYT